MVTVTGSVVPFVKQQVGRRQYYTSGTVRFMLVMPARSNQLAKRVSNGTVAQVHTDVDVRFDGTFKAQIDRNDEIVPAGSIYQVMIMIPNVNIVPMFYVFDGPGPFNLNVMTPTTAHAARDRQMQEIREKIADLQKQLGDLESEAQS